MQKGLTESGEIAPPTRLMKHSTLQKVIMTTVALAASFALTAQAGQPAFSSAKSAESGKSQPFSPTAKAAGSNSPSSTYMIDDGTMEDSVGFGNGAQNFESLWFNQFDVVPGQTMISTVSVAWGTPNSPDPSLDGTPVTIAVWSDPNGDGNPSDGVLLGSVAGTIQSSGTNTFVDYTFNPPIDVSAYTSFFIGDMTPMNNGPENFPQGLDENSALHRQSWVAAMSSGAPVDINNLGNNDFLGLIDDFGLPGNWGIRADAGGGGGELMLVSAGSRKTHGRAGTFDIPLPLTGNVGVECRSQTDQLEEIVMTFNNNVTGADSASSTCGNPVIVSVDPSNPHNLLVAVFGSRNCNGSVVTVTANNVHDDQGNTLTSASASVGMLLGDVTADGHVKNGDVSQVQAFQGQIADASNFRNDVTLDGRINRTDTKLVKSQRGHSLP